MYTMCGARCVLALVVLYVGLAQSWDIAVTKGHVLELYSDDTATVDITFDAQNITVLVYDEINDKLHYVDKQSAGDRICSYDISSNEYICLTEVNGRNIHGLAFDPATELLFFSDTNERSINWISLKHGSNNNIYGNLLIMTGDGIPTDVAVDSCRGYVYWINTNLAKPTIEKAAFNGSGREEVLIFTDATPHSLVIDQLTQKMYIIEQKRTEGNIYYSNLNGENPKFLAYITDDENLTYISRSYNSLTVSKTFLYWMNLCSDCDVYVWKLTKTYSNTTTFPYISLGNSVIGGIVANYKIKENYQYIQDCEPLTNLVQNNSDEPSCNHGQSVCKCTPGYIGERCDVQV